MARRKNDESLGCAAILGLLIVVAIGKFLMDHPGLIVLLIVIAVASILLWRHIASKAADQSQASRATPPNSNPSGTSRQARRDADRGYGSAWSDDYSPYSHSRYDRPDSGQREQNLRIYHSDIPIVTIVPGSTAILLDMDYISRNGNETTRRVRIDGLDLDAYGVLQFTGYCELRHDQRTFSTRGILRIRHEGRIIHRNQAPSFIKSQHTLTHFGRTERAIDSSQTLVDILTHIARASGNVSPSERRIIMSVILDSLGSHQPDENRMKAAIRESILSPSQFRTALATVATKGGTDLLILRSLVDDMASLKTSSEPYTQAAIQIARQHIGTNSHA